MRRRWIALLTFALAGCTGFDEIYLHDAHVYGGAPQAPCGCSGAPRYGSPPMPANTPPAYSGSSPLPQSREPELLR